VQIIDTAFFIPQLNRTRRVWIYLPASYRFSKKKYPVLYMHDGQNLFDDLTSFSGEWGVDEALDTLEKKGREIIVVAVDHGGDKRLNEYSPYDMERYGKGEGDLYVDFLVKTLKPFIDKNYRTHRRKKRTYIAGSSMGGLISMYAVMKYPKVFGGAGVFSPAFWIAPAIETALEHQKEKIRSRIYFYAGMQESETMVPDMLKVFQTLNKKRHSKMISVIRARGKHNEATWRKEFPLFYKWMVE
jgi:predicted alpha/beta superfamily hydrolase